MNDRFETSLMDLISSEVRRNTYGYGINNKLMLGGVNDEEGGSGVPWGGVVGRLIQRKVCYDFTEAAVVSGLSGYLVTSGSLLDNLNNIRWHQIPVTWFETMPTEPRSMEVHVASGIWYNDEHQYIDFAGGNSPTVTLPSGNPRIDILYLTPSGILNIGTGSEIPDPVVDLSNLPSGVLPISALFVTPTASGIGWGHEADVLGGYIRKDLRPFIVYPGGGGGGVTDHGSLSGLMDNDHDFYLPLRCVSVLSDGTVTEYDNPDDAFNAAGAGDTVLVPSGDWELTSLHTITNVSVFGIGGGPDDCRLYSTIGADGHLLRLNTSGTAFNIRVDWNIADSNGAHTALLVTTGCSAYFCTVSVVVALGDGQCYGMYVDGGTARQCIGIAEHQDGTAVGVYTSNSSVHHCEGHATVNGSGVVCAAYGINAYNHPEDDPLVGCVGIGTNNGSGTAYGLHFGGMFGPDVYVSHGHFAGDTADVLGYISDGYFYAVRYESEVLNTGASIICSGGDRTGKCRDEDITGNWTFGEPLVLSEQAADPAGGANEGRLYTKDDGSGNTELYYVDESSNVSKLTPPSGISYPTFLSLTDTPISYLGYGRYLVGVNVGETGLEFVLSSGGGVSTFINLTDTPSGYAGYAGYTPVVNDEEDGLEFVVASGGGASTFTGLTDTPANYAGEAGKLVTVTALEDGLEFITKASLGGSIDHGALLGLNDDDHSAVYPGYAQVETITGLWTFNRGAAAPFAVDAASLVVANLNADKLDGYEATAFPRKAEAATITGNFWTFDNKIEVAKDTNVASYFGRAFVGYDGYNSDYAAFGHLDIYGGATSYAIVQSTIGVTHLNTSGSMYFRVVNVVKMEMSAVGVLTVVGSVSAAYNSNTTSYFGRAAVGYNGTDSDRATFAHIDCNDGTKYALAQDSSGTTVVNSTSPMNFTIADVNKAALYSDGFRISNGLHVGSLNTAADDDDISYDGDLRPYRNATKYTGYVYVPITQTTIWNNVTKAAGTWPLDMSAYGCAPGCKAVNLALSGTWTTTGVTRYAYARKKSSGEFQCVIRSRVANEQFDNDAVVACDAAGDIDIVVGAAMSVASVFVTGYYI